MKKISIIGLLLVVKLCGAMESNEPRYTKSKSDHKVSFSLGDISVKESKAEAKTQNQYSSVARATSSNSTSIDMIATQVEADFLEWVGEEYIADYTPRALTGRYFMFFIKKKREFDKADSDSHRASLLAQMAYLNKKLGGDLL